jgi:hypothetical protein
VTGQMARWIEGWWLGKVATCTFICIDIQEFEVIKAHAELCEVCWEQRNEAYLVFECQGQHRQAFMRIRLVL